MKDVNQVQRVTRPLKKRVKYTAMENEKFLKLIYKHPKVNLY